MKRIVGKDVLRWLYQARDTAAGIKSTLFRTSTSFLFPYDKTFYSTKELLVLSGSLASSTSNTISELSMTDISSLKYVLFYES